MEHDFRLADAEKKAMAKDLEDMKQDLADADREIDQLKREIDKVKFQKDKEVVSNNVILEIASIKYVEVIHIRTEVKHLFCLLQIACVIYLRMHFSQIGKINWHSAENNSVRFWMIWKDQKGILRKQMIFWMA